MRTLLTISAWIRRFNTDTDVYGNQVRDSYTDEIVQCRISPVSAGSDEENRRDRNQVTWQYKLFFAGAVDIRHDDQVIVDVDVFPDGSGSGDPQYRNLVLEVVGSPMVRFDRQGRVHHIEATCRRVEG